MILPLRVRGQKGWRCKEPPRADLAGVDHTLVLVVHALKLADGADKEAAMIAVFFRKEVVGELGEVVADADVEEAMDIVGDFEEEAVIHRGKAEGFTAGGHPGPHQAVLDADIEVFDQVEVEAVDPEDDDGRGGLESGDFFVAELGGDLFDDLEAEGEFKHRDQGEDFGRGVLVAIVVEEDRAEFAALGVLEDRIDPVEVDGAVG